MSVLLSLALLAAMSALGIAILRRFLGHLTTLEHVAYGAPIGMVLGTLPLVPLAIAFGFTPAVVLGSGVGCALLAVVLTRSTPTSTEAWPKSPSELRHRIPWAPTLVIGAFAARWSQFFANAITFDERGMVAGHVNIWGDWPVHLGIVSSFVYGDNFPPTHPRFDGSPFSYHYLSDLTASAMTVLGMAPWDALSLHSWIGCVIVAVGLYAFGQRLLRRRGAATLFVVLFLLGGGLGWTYMLGHAAGTEDPWKTFTSFVWDYGIKTEQNFQVVNMFYAFLESQRAFLYGLPIAFTVFSTLLVAVRRPASHRQLFVIAGLIAGLLPLAHLSTLLAMVVIIPLLFLLFPSRQWFLFGVAAVIVALPQLLTQLGGGVGALSHTHFQLWWESAKDGPVLFWLKNLGLFSPLLLIALWKRDLVPPRVRRFLFAFMGIFVVVNVVAFQPWTWDNHKILVYWFLAMTLLVAGLLAWAWRRWRGILPRAGIAVAMLTMTLSGVFEDVGTFLGQSRYAMLSNDGIAFAAQVRERTDPRALLVIGPVNHDPDSMLTGRRIFVGYPNWLWTEGIPYEFREAVVQQMYRDLPNAAGLFAAYKIDYISVGPFERKEWGVEDAELLAMRSLYPVVAETQDWVLFDVRSARG
ncbi:MAG TPA: hypothetical protein VFC71_06130 [Candidatus Polarisedimenticolia bacterium]|nr:hypothetical protein [Candidatus Polarisedimenticolia bacterium]